MKRALSNRSIQEALIFFAVSAALAVYSVFKHYTGLKTEWRMSAYLFPLLVSALLAVLSAALLVRAVKELGTGTEKAAATDLNVKNFMLTLTLTALSCLAMKAAPFAAVAFVLMAALLTLLGERRWYVILGVSAGVSGALWLLFGLCLRVNLP